MQDDKTINGQPVIFGEVLFDCFPDGDIVLGGAPFNVAWHLQGMGVSPLLVTGVGDDERGRVVLDVMRDWGMSTEAVQVNPDYPTGVVAVGIDNGEPSYRIVPDQAYDHIEAAAALAAVQGASAGMIYHGSLALRNAASRAALDTLLAESDLPVFLDINIRDPWWDRAQTVPLLRRATWVKLNHAELGAAMRGRFETLEAQQQAAQELFVQCELQMLIVTRGGEGAFMVLPEGVVNGAPVAVTDFVDSVGAGDAFAAVIIAGLVRGWPLDETLNRALAFAAMVCQQRGATRRDRALYAGLLSAADG